MVPTKILAIGAGGLQTRPNPRIRPYPQRTESL